MSQDFFKHHRFRVAATATSLLVLAGIAIELEWIDTQRMWRPIRFGLALVPVLVSVGWVRWTLRSSVRVKAFAYTVAALLCWLGTLFAASEDRLRPFRNPLLTYGQGVLFFIGLGWTIWLVEKASRHYESLRDGDDTFGLHPISSRRRRRIWNPLDTQAWYYGRDNKRLNQSLSVLTSYVVLFFVVSVLISALRGGRDSYEMPGGGGGGGGGGGRAQMASLVQPVQLKKVTRRRLVINPYSSILFNAPPIDDIKLQLAQVTDHLYQAGMGKGGAGGGTGSGIGFGDGDGSGFGPGTSQGKVRFIRLEYSGGDWDQKMSAFSGENMLRQYGLRTQQKVAEKEEVRSIPQLKAFPAEKSPPYVYLTGQRDIHLSATDVKTLREYVLDKHGLLFIDNGGSTHFHNQVLSMMNQVLPNIRPTPIPLDDVVHRVPYSIPFLPFVAAHGGKTALGWRVDGRLAAYYHPGDIGDAWTDHQAGVKKEIVEYCYQLGVNVIFYAHVEYSKWLMSRMKK